MNFNLLPSLQQAAIVRIASLLYYDYEIENLTESIPQISDLFSPSRMGAASTHEQWKEVEMKAVEKLSPFLPSLLRKRVAKVIRPMHDEVHRWKSEHNIFLEQYGARCLLCRRCILLYLRWKTDGTIDRTETAKEIVANDSIDPKLRFIMACTYFLEDEILALWEEIEEVDKNMLDSEGTNSSVRFWMKWLQNKDINHWSERIDEFFTYRRAYPTDIPNRASCFYHWLSSESKQMYIAFTNTRRVHADNFQMCLNGMEEIERLEIFRNEAERPLLLCLRWPFRSLFTKFAKELVSFLTADRFISLLRAMLVSYVNYGFEDFHLLEEFWEMSPDALKGEAKKSLIMWTEWFLPMIFPRQNRLALEEVVRRCNLC
ncbi:hypothetical protein AVEN_87774-1 [Araneus ventricosus]|uniref:Uncharacterized protein n=1 Tax=Araneus ventricosus TaxID=182803 RepID=A0A4Y2QBK9_ARAVE|nr:hypothetical protein AVEN_87774-1 [Araneus ventricosus]